MSFLKTERLDIRGVFDEAKRIGAASVPILTEEACELLATQSAEMFVGGIRVRPLVGTMKLVAHEFQELVDREVNSYSRFKLFRKVLKFVRNFEENDFNFHELFHYDPGTQLGRHPDIEDKKFTAIFCIKGNGAFHVYPDSKSDLIQQIDNSPGNVVILKAGQDHAVGMVTSERYAFAMRQFSAGDLRVVGRFTDRVELFNIKART